MSFSSLGKLFEDAEDRGRYLSYSLPLSYRDILLNVIHYFFRLRQENTLISNGAFADMPNFGNWYKVVN